MAEFHSSAVITPFSPRMLWSVTSCMLVRWIKLTSSPRCTLMILVMARRIVRCSGVNAVIVHSFDRRPAALPHRRSRRGRQHGQSTNETRQPVQLGLGEVGEIEHVTVEVDPDQDRDDLHGLVAWRREPHVDGGPWLGGARRPCLHAEWTRVDAAT